MAVPRNRHSTARRNSRRAHQALKARTLTECPHCGAARLPHRACASCGMYKGRVVVQSGEKEDV